MKYGRAGRERDDRSISDPIVPEIGSCGRHPPKEARLCLLDNGIYFVNPKTTPHPTIDFFNFATSRTSKVATIEKEVQLTSPSLAVSPDGRWLLYAEVDYFENDIMLVENFR